MPTFTLLRVSVAPDGTPGNGDSGNPAISADGRYIAFGSSASNLVAGDTNAHADIFVRDLVTNQTTRVSVAFDGTQANGDSWDTPAISADGRYVAFRSNANNLVAGGTNGDPHVFVRDLVTNQTTLVSVASGGAQENGASRSPAISADGRYVAFMSDASNLVSGDVHGGVFMRDIATNQTTLVSVASDGAQGNGASEGPAISADGRYVAFWSDASNLVASDINGGPDVFMRDMVTNQTTRVSVASDAAQAIRYSGYPAISADGRHVSFTSSGDNPTSQAQGLTPYNVFVRDLAINQTTNVSVAPDGAQANSSSEYSAISADGRYVAFESAASNLVVGDTNGAPDVFVRDLATNETTRMSVATDGAQGNYASQGAAISADGRYIAFRSYASNLVAARIRE